MRHARGLVLVGLTVLGFQASVPAAQAQDAKRCISIGGGSTSQVMRNTCNREIEVVWCHNSSRKGTTFARCGERSRHYQQRSTLKPGQSKVNRYSLPTGAQISYAACYGGYNSVQIDGSRFGCKTNRSTASNRGSGGAPAPARAPLQRGGDSGTATRGGKATGCVSFSRGSRSQIMRNTCNRAIGVVWCHDSSQRGAVRSRCGERNRHFQQRTSLNPGQTNENRYTLPFGARITFGACYGGSTSIRVSGRSYSCK